MNKDVRVGTGYPNHPKIRKLEKELGAEGIKSHTFLLCSTALYFPSGEFNDLDSEDIAILAQWKRDANHFVNTLVKLKLLDNQGKHFSIHNWLRWNLFAASAPKRSEIARANAKKRWDKKNKLIQRDDANGNADSNTDCNTPSPKGRVGEAAPRLEARPPAPPITMNEILELATKIENKEKIKGIRDSCIDAEKRGVEVDQLYMRLLNARITGYKKLAYNIRKVEPRPSS